MRVALSFMGMVVVFFRVGLIGPSLAFDCLRGLKCLIFSELAPSSLTLRRLGLSGLAGRIFRLAFLCCFVQVISFVRCRWRKTRQNQGF